MRATISFEAEVERVNEVMLALAKEETDRIRGSAHTLTTGQPHEVHQCLTRALEGLYASITQLEQYRDMVASFQSARFSALLPQPADPGNALQALAEARDTVQQMKQFDTFVDRVNTPVEEGKNSDKPKER